MEAHEKGIEAADKAYHDSSFEDHSKDMERAIKAYLDASGMVLVPALPTQEMLEEVSSTKAQRIEYGQVYIGMTCAAPSPFHKQEDGK